MITYKTKLLVQQVGILMKYRGLEEKGKVQQFVDSEVLRRTDPYVPFLNGALKESGVRHTVIGGGQVVYKTPYARRQYFENKGGSGGLRGKMWFERMKADHKDDILKGAIKMAGGTVR